MAIAELGKAAAAQRAQQSQVPPPVPPEDQAIIEVETAFLVYRLPTGEVVADTNINSPIVPARPPHPHDILGMLNAAAGDVAIMAHAPYIANTVVQVQMNAARQMQQQHQQVMAEAAIKEQRRKSGQ